MNKTNEEYYQEVLKKFTDLLEKSELRIDKTNAMICQLVEVTGDAYTIFKEQLNQVKALQEQNKHLVQINSTLHSNLKESCKRYNNLLEKILHLPQTDNNNKTEINVNK